MSEDDEFAALLGLLQRYPQGISEHVLLKSLYEPLPVESRPDLSDTLVLFQQHFLLFHQLYRLRDYLRRQILRDDSPAHQYQDLRIETLCIVLLDVESAATGLPDSPDPLRDYYLDLDNLRSTGRHEVDDLLGSFWVRFGRAAAPVSSVSRRAALAVLELPEDASFSCVRRRYRELMSIHHPDRGGSAERSQEINAAMEVLKSCFAEV